MAQFGCGYIRGTTIETYCRMYEQEQYSHSEDAGGRMGVDEVIQSTTSVAYAVFASVIAKLYGTPCVRPRGSIVRLHSTHGTARDALRDAHGCHLTLLG